MGFYTTNIGGQNLMSKLTATTVVKAKPKAKQYKLADSGGMYLLIYPSGSKYWRYDYSYAAKRTVRTASSGQVRQPMFQGCLE